MSSDAFDVNKQLSFYAAYHTNKINVAIHILCVPLIQWTFLVFLASLPYPENAVLFHYDVAKYLVLEFNISTVVAVAWWLYFLVLEPSGALSYFPQIALMNLSAIGFAQNVPGYINIAVGLHVFSWLAQFAGHAFAEKRAPALLDNLLGALVLAPFFVHLELLFPLGFKPALRKQVQNMVGVELTRIRREEGKKKRAQANAKAE